VRRARTPGQRDRDRILYTSALRRLATVTQVVAPTEGHVVHNRLTHSFEVAQIGRRLAERLVREQADLANAHGGVDPDVVEAAALAHDLGHPPFGHLAEEELHSLARDEGVDDGFNGNAQSFRIVTRLAIRLPRRGGLDLTRATLNAILKYPWQWEHDGTRSEKWGAYRTEEDIFRWVRRTFPSDSTYKAVEAEIMDWADDVAYSVHDVEDFYRAGVMPLERLTTSTDEGDLGAEAPNGESFRSEEARRFLASAYDSRRIQGLSPRPTREQIDSAFDDALDWTSARPYDGTRLQRGILSRWKSRLIGRFMGALNLEEARAQPARSVGITPEYELQVNILKELTWYYVINSTATATQRYGQRRVVHDLFCIFLKSAQSSTQDDWLIFPRSYQEELIRLLSMGADGQQERVRTNRLNRAKGSFMKFPPFDTPPRNLFLYDTPRLWKGQLRQGTRKCSNGTRQSSRMVVNQASTRLTGTKADPYGRRKQQ
jgi:dGTPase